MSGLAVFSLGDLVVALQRRGQYVFAKSDSVRQFYSYKAVLKRVVEWGYFACDCGLGLLDLA